MPCGEAARLWCERRFLFIHLDEYADLTPPCEAGVGHHNRWQCVTNSGELGKKMPLPMDRQEPSFQQRNPVSSRTPPSSASRGALARVAAPAVYRPLRPAHASREVRIK